MFNENRVTVVLIVMLAFVAAFSYANRPPADKSEQAWLVTTAKGEYLDKNCKLVKTTARCEDGIYIGVSAMRKVVVQPIPKH